MILRCDIYTNVHYHTSVLSRNWIFYVLIQLIEFGFDAPTTFSLFFPLNNFYGLITAQPTMYLHLFMLFNAAFIQIF